MYSHLLSSIASSSLSLSTCLTQFTSTAQHHLRHSFLNMVSERVVVWSNSLNCVVLHTDDQENRFINWEANDTMNTQNGSAFPTKKFDRTNFASWEYKMHQYLIGQGYWSYINGAHENQPNPAWEQTVRHVLYYLASCVHDHMLDYIWEAKTPKEAFGNLKKNFVANTAKFFLRLGNYKELQEQISFIMLGNYWHQKIVQKMGCGRSRGAFSESYEILLIVFNLTPLLTWVPNTPSHSITQPMY